MRLSGLSFTNSANPLRTSFVVSVILVFDLDLLISNKDAL